MGSLNASSAAADVSAWLQSSAQGLAVKPPGRSTGMSGPSRSAPSEGSGNDAVLVFLPGIKEITTVRSRRATES